jgi:hypothetical protein
MRADERAGARTSQDRLNKCRKSEPSGSFYTRTKVGKLLRSVSEEIMRVLKLQFLLLSVPLLLAIAASAAAQGVIVPGPCNRCPELPRPVALPRSLPIKSIKIDTKIA